MTAVALPEGYKTLIDEEDFHWFEKYDWWLQKSDRGGNYVVSKREGRIIRLHRVILDVTNPNVFVDHINNDSLDNRKCNLRKCDKYQNAANIGLTKNNTSGYKGVSFDKRSGLWRVAMTVKGVKHNLGKFDDPKEAAKAYDEFALAKLGEFAKTNKQMGLI